MNRIHDRTMWRRVLAADLGLFNAAMFAFAAIPPNDIIAIEGIAMVASLAALVGVVAHSCRRFNLPGESYSYLITSMVGMYVLLGYTSDHVPTLDDLPIILFVCSGIASGLAAHIIDGGPNADG